MKEEHFLRAIEDCDNGLIEFNLGTRRSFLYANKWYPLRKIVNATKALNGDANNLTTNNAQIELCKFLGYVRVEHGIDFQSNYPIPLRKKEVLEEVNKLSKLIASITN